MSAFISLKGLKSLKCSAFNVPRSALRIGEYPYFVEDMSALISLKFKEFEEFERFRVQCSVFRVEDRRIT